MEQEEKSFLDEKKDENLDTDLSSPPSFGDSQKSLSEAGLKTSPGSEQDPLEKEFPDLAQEEIHSFSLPISSEISPEMREGKSEGVDSVSKTEVPQKTKLKNWKKKLTETPTISKFSSPILPTSEDLSVPRKIAPKDHLKESQKQSDAKVAKQVTRATKTSRSNSRNQKKSVPKNDLLKNKEFNQMFFYLDDLLSSLPKRKIEAFARSDHYDTYLKILDQLKK